MTSDNPAIESQLHQLLRCPVSYITLCCGGLRTRVRPGNHALDWGPFPSKLSHGMAVILRGKGRPIVKYRDTLRSPVRKRLNRSICRLGCELRWAKNSQVQSYSPCGAPVCPHGRTHWRHLANTSEPSVCGSDAVLCQITLIICFFHVAVHCRGHLCDK